MASILDELKNKYPESEDVGRANNIAEGVAAIPGDVPFYITATQYDSRIELFGAGTTKWVDVVAALKAGKRIVFRLPLSVMTGNPNDRVIEVGLTYCISDGSNVTLAGFMYDNSNQPSLAKVDPSNSSKPTDPSTFAVIQIKPI